LQKSGNFIRLFLKVQQPYRTFFEKSRNLHELFPESSLTLPDFSWKVRPGTLDIQMEKCMPEFVFFQEKSGNLTGYFPESSITSPGIFLKVE
jgi:hypothetical protein